MIVDLGPPISVVDVVALENKIGATLPNDYREFLLSNNGGRPEPDGVRVLGYDETDVQILFGVGRPIKSSCIDWNLEILEKRLPEYAVPIGSDSGGNVFYVSLEVGNRGSVLYLALDAVYGSDSSDTPTYEVNSSFENFIRDLFE